MRAIGNARIGVAPIMRFYCIRSKLDYLLDDTKIIYQAQNKLDLPVFEALHIYNHRPKLNENLYDFFCLKLFNRHS